MKNAGLFFLLFMVNCQVFAQDEQQFKFDHTISSTAFGDERQITVYLPPSYYEDPKEEFTVTYILDGHFDPFIDMAVKTIEYSTYMYKYTPTIVVGIHAKARGWEFSAPIEGDEDDQNYVGGRAPELQKHFEQEVFPLIDSMYSQTIPFRTIIGHSSGGGFVLHTLFNGRKDLFDAYVAISPAIRSDNEYIIESAASKLEAGERFSKFLYCSSGSVGEREILFGGAINRLDSIFNAHPNHGLIWEKSKFEGMGHWTCVSPSFNMAMVKLTRAYRVDEQMFYDFAQDRSESITDQLTSFYKDRNDNYGFSDIPQPGYIYQSVWWISNEGKSKEAIEICDWALTHYPDNLTLNKTKAKFHLKIGENEHAKKSFERCLVVLEKIKEKFDEEEYVDQKEYLNGKITQAMEEVKK